MKLQALLHIAVYEEGKFDIQEKKITLKGLFTQLMTRGGSTIPCDAFCRLCVCCCNVLS